MIHHRMAAPRSNGLTAPVLQPGPLLAWLGIFAALLWAFWPTFRRLWGDWHGSGEYSVGGLVPIVALYLLWNDRAALGRLPRRPAWLAGLAIIAVAQAAMFFGLALLFESAERYGAILTAVGVIVLVTGRQFSWRIKWILAFLFLMVPLPGRVHNLISGPLQDIATRSAVVTLELLGTTVSREGNVMVLNENTRLAVAEACSGLRMLTAFIVVAYTLAYLVNRPGWQKAVVLFSSIPVAIACNTARLIVTAWLFLWTSSELAEAFFHDFAGLTMMPAAVFLLALELWLMNKIVVPEAADISPRRARRSEKRLPANAPA